MRTVIDRGVVLVALVELMMLLGAVAGPLGVLAGLALIGWEVRYWLRSSRQTARPDDWGKPKH